jgi:DNA mismatch repair protein MutS2
VDQTTLETLEFPSVLKELASFSMTPVGKEEVEALRPSASVPYIEEAFREYSELAGIIKVSGTLPLGGIGDIRPVLSRLDPEGAFLLAPDLLLIRSNITATSLIKSLNTASFSKLYPRISARIEDLSMQDELKEELERILDDRGEIKDTASTALFRIRKEIRANKDRARKILESITTDKDTKEYLQEDIISIRDDRYVLAIKAGVHAGFQGVVHGRSGSGATYFIEPIALVELNNKVAILKKEEKTEEIEILKEATRKVGLQREPLLSDLEAAASIDAIQSKALFGREIGAIVPEIREKGEVKLLSALHPILVFKEMRGASRAIPIDIVIPEDRAVLVISGANTGGKTVALKTLGLLTLMALSALPIPVAEGSVAVAFSEIFSDIGDRQDIIASLSTFSAHVKRMGEFLENAAPGSLVLIDEIGAGTDPSEGGAFALAALETLREQGAKIIITTHLNLLKAHAQVNLNYLNASVEFDEKTLRPLYRLRYGMPGPSMGLSIAQSLGIPEAVINRAYGYIKEKEGAFIESIRILEEEKENVRKLRERIEALEAQKSKALERLRQDRGAMVERAKRNIETMVGKAGDEIRESIQKFRAEGKAASGKRTATEVLKAGERLKEKLGHKKERYSPKKGDRVSLSGSNTKGTVVTVDTDGKKAEVMVGNLKVWAPWDKLEKRGVQEAKPSQGMSLSADMDIASTLNIIGMRVEEALPVVTKFLDNAHSSGLHSVDIIHGVGTGALSRAVEDNLKRHPLVKSFHHADPSRGGGGVTVVELK